MPARSLPERVEILEHKVGDLQSLPSRMTAVESQILQLRGEIRDECSAIRQRFDGIDESNEETRRQMRVLYEEVLARISLLAEGRGRRKR